MDLSKMLEEFSTLMDSGKLADAIKLPISLIDDKVSGMIPSIHLGSDGPVLKSLFLVTSNFFIEVRLGAKEDFDFIALNSIENYRIEINEHKVKKADGEEISYELAKVIFQHTLYGFLSELNYVGNDRKSWLEKVTKLIPIKIILKC